MESKPALSLYHDMGKCVNTCEIIWPDRFDILVRIDFLEWFETTGRNYLSESDLGVIEADLLMSSPQFFVKAKQHPYFFQYTKLKHQYRLANLTYQEAEPVYAEGIANFIKLNESIKGKPFNLGRKIILKKPLLRIKEYPRKWYIGDGCHRLACLLWLHKGFLIPSRFFKSRYKLTYNPGNSNLTTGYRLLGILRQEDIRHFDRLFTANTPEWNSTFQWVGKIGERFKLMNIEDMFNITFKRLDFA